MTTTPAPDCPSCGTGLPEAARFCPGCGLELQRSPAAEERRLVTVVFADIEGFTTLSEHRDPESVKELLDACFGRLVPVIDAHGGHVDKIIGDELMAVFGAPTAHEDDAERAVRAALALIDALHDVAPDLRLRVGINTGEVLAGAVGPASGYTVTGDVVNTAHRLASAAHPGEVLVGERTYLATLTAIAFHSRGQFDLKGKQEPVTAWAADRVTPGPTHRVPDGAVLPLVGRDRELADLHGQVIHAIDAGRSELITLVGEAGVGKTRLAMELTVTLAARPAVARVLWASCSPFGSEGDLTPLVDLARSALGVPATLDRDTQRTLLADRLAGGSVGTGTASLGARLSELLGLGPTSTGLVEAEPRSGRAGPSEQQLVAVATVLSGLAEQRPLVVVVDDLHWAGSRLVRFLTQLPDWLPDRPIVVLGLARDDLLERHAALLGGTRRASTRTLEPLTAEASAELIGSILATYGPTDPRVGPDALNRLVRASGGSPLLIEQLVRFLVESGQVVEQDGRWTWIVDETGNEASLPDGVRSLIGARLDALPADERGLLGDAAVFGRRFWRDALVALSPGSDDDVDALLDRLASRGLTEAVEDDGFGNWAFRHALTRDVAYAALPLADRAVRHASAAAWIERLPGARREPRPIALLAYHYERAVALSRAVDHPDATLVAPAFAALVRAARDERRREGLRRSDQWYRRARAIGSGDADSMIEVVAEHGQVLLELGSLDAAQQAFDELGRRAGHTRPPMAALAEAHLGAVARLQGDTDLARERFDAAAARWRSLDDLQGVADTLRLQGWAEFTAGRPRAAMARLRHASAIEEQLDEPVRRSETLRYLGWCEFLSGALVAAQEHLWEAARLAADTDEDGATAWCIGLLGHTFLRAGRAGQALDVARNLRATIGQGSDPWSEWTCATLEAAALVALGDVVGGGALAAQAVERFEELDDAWGLGIARLVLAQSRRAQGDRDGARQVLRATVEARRVPGMPTEDARGLAELARLDLDDGRRQEAERQARAALALVRAGIGDDESGLKATVVLADLAAAAGNIDGAEILLEEVAADRLPGDRTETWRLAALALADRRLDRGDRAGAEALVDACRDPACDTRSIVDAIAAVDARLAGP